jgi:DNA modification methylase
MLVDLIQEMDTGEIPVMYTGYTEDDLAKIIAAMEGADDTVPGDVDEVPEPPAIPMTKPGDLWILGPHRLLCGSATDRAHIERLMNGEKARLVFTDPPYGVSYVSQSGKFAMIKNDDLTGDKLAQDLLIPAFKNYVAFSDDDAPFYIWHASSTRKDFDYAISAAGLIENQYIIWAKNGVSLGHADYLWAHEPCYYCSKAGVKAAFYGDRAQPTVWRATYQLTGRFETVLGTGIVLTDGKGGKIYLAPKPPKGKKLRYIRVEAGNNVDLYDDAHQDNLWEVSRETKTEHPTQKPVELIIRALENSSRPGELAIDFFGGSGSLIIGCELSGRRGYSTELDPKYCDVIVNRYVRVSGNIGAICVRDGEEIPYTKLKAQNDEVNSHGEQEE